MARTSCTSWRKPYGALIACLVHDRLRAPARGRSCFRTLRLDAILTSPSCGRDLTSNTRPPPPRQRRCRRICAMASCISSRLTTPARQSATSRRIHDRPQSPIPAACCPAPSRDRLSGGRCRPALRLVLVWDGPGIAKSADSESSALAISRKTPEAVTRSVQFSVRQQVHSGSGD